MQKMMMLIMILKKEKKCKIGISYGGFEPPSCKNQIILVKTRLKREILIGISL